jgi:hypothetical protein
MKKEVQVSNLETSLTKLDGFTSVEDMKKWATAAIDSGLLPHSITEPEQVMVIVQHGKELGLSPFVAINNIHVISGRPTVSSAMLGSLLKKRDVEWTWDEDFVLVKNDKGEVEVAPDNAPNRRTTIHFYWKSKVTDRVMEAPFSVTWAQFVLSDLVKRDNWKKMPKEMMRARCLAFATRALFPEVMSGLYTEVEIQDTFQDENYVIDVNEEGEIILTDNKKEE